LYIESLIFATDKSLNLQDLKTTLNTHFKSKVKEEEIEAAIETITEKYKSEDYSFEVICINGGYSFMTKGAYHPLISQYLKLESKKKLSKAALETLAIVSYKQPATKSNIEAIRGVNCDYSIQKLLEKELIEMKGRAEGPGRPLLYGTTQKFMDHLGLSSINELPKLKELEINEDNAIGMMDGESSSDTNVKIDSDGKVSGTQDEFEQDSSETVSEVIDLTSEEEDVLVDIEDNDSQVEIEAESDSEKVEIKDVDTLIEDQEMSDEVAEDIAVENDSEEQVVDTSEDAAVETNAEEQEAKDMSADIFFEMKLEEQELKSISEEETNNSEDVELEALDEDTLVLDGNDNKSNEEE